MFDEDNEIIISTLAKRVKYLEETINLFIRQNQEMKFCLEAIAKDEPDDTGTRWTKEDFKHLVKETLKSCDKIAKESEE